MKRKFEGCKTNLLFKKPRSMWMNKLPRAMLGCMEDDGMYDYPLVGANRNQFCSVAILLH